MLVDTLFDIPLTREMLEAMRPVTEARPIDAAVNTHGNGDHCFGNGALPAETAIYATARAVADMREEPPELLRTVLATDMGAELNEFAARIFGPFQFDGLEARLPSETFEGRSMDFWNMGGGSAKVDFDSLESTWDGPVHAGLRTHHVFVDLKAPGGGKVALKERWFVTHPRYPVLLPVAQVAVLETFHAGEDEEPFRPLYAAFFPALLLVLYVGASRWELGGGWWLTANVLAKAEYVNQKYVGYPAGNIKSGGQFRGVMAEGVIAF